MATTSPTKTFGDYVREIRSQLSQTQAEFAQSVGVEQATVSRWEKGTSTPTVDKYKSVLIYAEQSGLDTAGLAELMGGDAQAAKRHLSFIKDNVPIIGEVKEDCILSFFEEGDIYGVAVPPGNLSPTTRAFHSVYPRGLRLRDGTCTCFFNDNKSTIGRKSFSKMSLICDIEGMIRLGIIVKTLNKNSHAVLMANNQDLEIINIAWAEKIMWIIV